MSQHESRRFDGPALYAALDARRQVRALSWQQVANEVGMAAGTLQRTREDGDMETDGILAMVRWLGVPLEDFIVGPNPIAAPAPSPDSGRFNIQALHAALDARRRARGMTWREVGQEIGGLPAGMLTRLAKGGRINVRVMVPAVGWLGCTVESFTRKHE